MTNNKKSKFFLLYKKPFLLEIKSNRKGFYVLCQN